MLIYLMRHGQTEWNVSFRMQGRSDVPLNEVGLEQARKAAAGMRQIPFDCILSSPLMRARQTAEIIAEGRQVPVRVVPCLAELDFGALEGKCRLDYPEAQTYFHDPEHYVPWAGGETYGELDDRCADALEHVLQPLETTCGHVLVCSHAAFITGIVRRILDRPLRDFWIDPPQTNCSCTIVECKNGAFRVVERGRIFG